MLAVYLHHDNSVLTNVFCTQVLCADAVVGEEHAKNPKGIVSRDAVMLCGVPYRLIVVIPVPILCTAATICPQFFVYLCLPFFMVLNRGLQRDVVYLG
jgi:hypothetical protein